MDKDLDEDTVYEIDSESSILGITPVKVTTQDRKEALAKALDEMEERASQDGMILNEAQQRVKDIIENYIVAIGDATGKHYRVKFVSTSEEMSPSLVEETEG